MRKRKRGRPPKNGETFSVMLRILITPKQRRCLEDALKGGEISPWARKVLTREAKKLLNE